MSTSVDARRQELLNTPGLKADFLPDPHREVAQVIPFPTGLKVFGDGAAGAATAAEATLLATTDGRPLTKRYYVGADGEVEREDYTKAAHFYARTVRLDTLAAIADLLRRVSPDICLIRGAPLPDLDLSKPVLRRIHSAPDGAACFEPCARTWAMLDFDGVPGPDLADPAAVGLHLVSLLPDAFSVAGWVCQLSSGHLMPGNAGKIKAHLFFLLSRPVTDEELGVWLRDTRADPNVFRAVQPHYIAAPILDGVPDPCPQRIHLEPGLFQEVVDVPPALSAGERTRPTGARTLQEPPHGWDHPEAVERWANYLSTFRGVAENEPYGGHGKAGRHNRAKELVSHGWDLGIWAERVCSDAIEWDARANRPPIGPRDVSTCVDYHYGINGKSGNAQNDPGCKFQLMKDAFKEQIDQLKVKAEPEEPAGIDPNRVYSLTEMDALHLPDTEWQVDGLIVKGLANLCVGPGGLGKTQAALLMSTCLAVGLPFLKRDTRQCVTLFVSAEDPPASLRARLHLLCRHLGIDPRELDGRMFTWSRYGMGGANSLARIDDYGCVEGRPFAEQLLRKIEEVDAGFVVLDTVRSFCRFNPNADEPVDALAKEVLDPLCKMTGATVLPLHHPTWAALKEGRDVGGAMSWQNAFRNVLTYLAAKPEGDAREKMDRHRLERYLCRNKDNEPTAAPALLEHYFMGGIPMLLNKGAADRPSNASMVYEVAAELLRQGVTIVPANGNGHKPLDIARVVKERWGVTLKRQDVLAELHALEREGRLRYRHAVGKVKAGYYLPDRPDFPAAAAPREDQGEDARRQAMTAILERYAVDNPGKGVSPGALAGLIAAETGDTEQALLEWLDAIAKDPEHPLHKCFAGTTATRRGQQWRAQEN